MSGLQHAERGSDVLPESLLYAIGMRAGDFSVITQTKPSERPWRLFVPLVSGGSSGG